MTAPVNQSLHLAGNTLSVEGTTDTSENDYIEVQVKFEQFYDDGDSDELTNWLSTDGTVEDWYFDITVDDDWVDPDESYTLVYARALNEAGEASVIDIRIVRFARMTVSISEPPLGTASLDPSRFQAPLKASTTIEWNTRSMVMTGNSATNSPSKKKASKNGRSHGIRRRWVTVLTASACAW